MNGNALKGHLDLMILSVLADKPMHGYAVIEEIRSRSERAIDIPEGTMYPALHRLEKAGLITSTWGEVKGRRRRSYHVVEAGTRQLTVERRSWREFVAAVGGVTGSPA